MNKRKLPILIILILAMTLALFGCSKQVDTTGAVKVTFELEGGQYLNSPKPLVYYYWFEPGTTNLIKDPAAENKDDRFNQEKVVQRESYVFEGWYRTRTEVDGKVTYSDKWDFSRDKVGDEGVTLYAKWERNRRFTYQIYYKDDNDVLIPIGSPYVVSAGDKFNDILEKAKTRSGYTFISFSDEAGSPWDNDFEHPGGEESVEIKVIANYTRGEFVLVSTAQELVDNRNKDIRLARDIDMSTLPAGTLFYGFGNTGSPNGGYRNHLFDGAGYTVSNIKISYKSGRDDLEADSDLYDENNGRGVLGISLFGKAVNAEVYNVTFDNVTIDLDTTSPFVNKIIVSPLCLKSTNSRFTDVTVNGTVTCTTLPTKFDHDYCQDNLVVLDGTGANKSGCFFKDGDSVLDNVTAGLTNLISIV